MKALILAAGEGKRLRPLTINTPKPLLMVAGKPLLAHSIEVLQSAGVNEITILVGYQGNRIKERMGDGSKMGVDIDYLEQRERLGTAHAINQARSLMTGAFLVMAGDVVVDPETVANVIDLHNTTGAEVITAARVEDPHGFGVMEVNDGRLITILEKPEVPPSNLINASIYLLTPRVFEAIARTTPSERNEYEITDTLNIMAADGDVRVYEMEKEWIDIGRPWDLLRANKLLLDRQTGMVEGDVEGGAHLMGDVVVEAGARVRSGAYIEGPVYISRDCDVGPNCFIRPYTCLGPSCRVGHAVELKNVLVMGETNIPHHNYVGDSVIGRRCNLGSGTKVANLRFDDRNVRVLTDGGFIDTGRRKLGAIMGDDVKTGINAMIEPGTVIHNGAIIGAGARARGTIGPGTIVY